MAHILDLPGQDPIWPFFPSRLGEFYPNTLFGSVMTTEQLASFGCFEVELTPAPTVSNGEIVREIMPIKGIDDVWVQRWEVVPAPPPQPDYDTLYGLLLISPAYNAFIAKASNPATSTPAMLVAQSALTDALREARTKQPIIPALQAGLAMMLAAADFEEPELNSLRAILIQANLAELFIV